MDETVWSVSMELVDKIFELTNDRKLCDDYKSRLTKASWHDSDKRAKAHRSDLSYFSGKDSFYPSEC